MRRLVIGTLAAATACSAGRSRVDVAPADGQSVVQYVTTAAAGSAPAKAGFEYRRVHAGAGQFITADVLAAAADEPLRTVLQTRLLGFASFDGAAMSRGDQSRCLDVYIGGLRVL